MPTVSSRRRRAPVQHPAAAFPDSLNGSSNSSHGDKRKVADGEYRIIQIAATPDRADRTRITMQANDPQQRIVLDLPQITFDKQQLVVGDAMYAQNRAYGIEFGRSDKHQPFYLCWPTSGTASWLHAPSAFDATPRAGAGRVDLRGAGLFGGGAGGQRGWFLRRLALLRPWPTADRRRTGSSAALRRRAARGTGGCRRRRGAGQPLGPGLVALRYPLLALGAGLALRGRAWSARQLYYACDESRPRIFDQGLAGFALGTDDPAMGYVSVVRLPAEAIAALRPALLDGPRVQHLLASQYSASAYAFSVRYQNCNQWVMEMLAAGWGDLPDGDDLRARAQAWLRDAHYTPQPVQVGSRWLMLASHFVPLLHLDDHPDEDRSAMQLRISLPSTVEAFVHQRYPASTRVEMCHDDERIVIHRGWTPIAAGCKPGEGDRVVSLRD